MGSSSSISNPASCSLPTTPSWKTSRPASANGSSLAASDPISGSERESKSADSRRTRRPSTSPSTVGGGVVQPGEFAQVSPELKRLVSALQSEVNELEARLSQVNEDADSSRRELNVWSSSFTYLLC